MGINRSVLSFLSACVLTAALLILTTTPVGGGQDTIRILIDTKELTLKVMQGDRETLALKDIAIGRYGATTDKRRGDHKTPLGRFTIAWITDKTSFHRFFGFRYPTKEYAERAFQKGLLDQKSRNRILQAFASGRLPPQNTVLGGNLGIHGIGKGDISIHEQYNWTSGCVALTNDQIDSLTPWVTIGTVVEIR